LLEFDLSLSHLDGAHEAFKAQAVAAAAEEERGD